LNEKKRTIKILIGLCIILSVVCISFVAAFSANEHKTVVATKNFENIQEKYKKATK